MSHASGDAGVRGPRGSIGAADRPGLRLTGFHTNPHPKISLNDGDLPSNGGLEIAANQSGVGVGAKHIVPAAKRSGIRHEISVG